MVITYYDTLYKREASLKTDKIVFDYRLNYATQTMIPVIHFESMGHKYEIETEYLRRIRG